MLDTLEYEPLAFYEDKNSLICRNRIDNNIYFVNVNTSNKEKIYIDKPKSVASGIVVIDDYSCLFYSKYRTGPFFWEAEYKDAWIYWVDSKKEEKYIKNFNISSGIYKK